MYSFGQTTIVNEQFSATAPSGWSSTSNSWVLNYNAASTVNYQSPSYSARFPSASNGNSVYLYIPVNFKSDYTYTIVFYTKRACRVTINVNETANQTTLLQLTNSVNTSCNSNWNTWYEWSDVFYSTYDGLGYFQIKIGTVYGGPASVYLDDITIYESPPIALPIELLYFKGLNDDNTNKLYWSTASERNNDYFTIEKSYDGYIFKDIDYIVGAGHSTHQLFYEYHDSNIQPFITYYRLKQTDYDGKSESSEIISIDTKVKDKPTIIKTINILGQEVSSDYNGLIIYIYTDGSVMKINNQK